MRKYNSILSTNGSSYLAPGAEVIDVTSELLCLSTGSTEGLDDLNDLFGEN